MNKQTKKELKRISSDLSEESDSNFAFVAGYTSGGAAYGITHEEMEKLNKDDESTDLRISDSIISENIEKMRPAEHIRNQLDIGYTFENNTLQIFEIRPQWNDPSKIQHSPFVKAKFIKSKQIWKIYWLRGNLKWYSYAPHPTTDSLADLFEIINKDDHGCFKG
jgi:hypothetical protein